MLLKIKERIHALMNLFKRVPLKVSFIYFVISFFWILLSDRVVQYLVEDNKIKLILNIGKGWFYVIVITIILYLLLTRAFKRQEAAEDRLNRAQSIAKVGNWELDIARQTLWASEEAFRLYGITYNSTFLPLKLVQSLVCIEDRLMLDQTLKRLISENSDYNLEFRIIRQNDQQERVIHSIAKLEHNAEGIPIKVLGVMRDVTEENLAEQNLKQSHEELTALYEELAASDEELKEQFDQIHRLAYNDSVTKLPNRLWLQEKLAEIIQPNAAKIAFLFIDLDNFKYINDTFGHFFGDTVLAEMGKRLTDLVDSNACVARLGGDGFAVVITNIEELEHVKEFAQKLLLKLETSIKENDISIHLSASIGIAIYPDHSKGFEELLKNADTAMYKAKKQGKNQYVIYDQSMNQELYTKVSMESNLRSAIDNNELLLYYQPIYSLKENKICGFEALARWKSPVYGMVAPSTFIPLAEETGLITQIGKWVLHTACKFIASLNNSRIEKLMISVNISVCQLAQDNFVDELLYILNENELNKEYLQLEITESILMEDVESKLEKIDTLKRYGIKVALDDFGTGYSSLTYLKKLPISILKLDKAFIDDITINKMDNDIMKSILMLADTLELSVVAEGVEEKDQYDCLAGFGCEMIQGYYISRPVPEDEVERVLQIH